MILITAMGKVGNQIQNRPYKEAQEFLVVTKLEDAHTEVEERVEIGLEHPSQGKGYPAWAKCMSKLS